MDGGEKDSNGNIDRKETGEL